MEVIIGVIFLILIVGLVITLAAVKAITSSDKAASKISSLVMKNNSNQD